MPLKRRPLDRESGVVRDASLVVIASEDTYAVRQYLAKFHVTRVQFKVLPSEGGRSSPEAVLERLDGYRREYEISEGDEFWVCIDLDHWAEPGHIANLRRVQKEGSKKGYEIALSSPCFDFWVLLHFEDPPSGGIRRCDDIAERLRQILGGFTKKSIQHLRFTQQQVEQAVERARQLPNANSLAPSGPTTQMHRILESLLAREAIRLKEPR